MLTIKTYVALVLVLTIAALTAVGILNYTVNPYGLYGTTYFPPLVIQPRTDKYKLMMADPGAGEILLLGSSRMFLMRPSLVTELTGMRAFNATVPLTMPRDYLIFTRFALDVMPVKHILAGIDLQGFHPTVIWDDGSWLSTSPLRPYADNNAPGRSPEKTMRELFSLQQVVHSLESLQKFSRSNAAAEPFPYKADGSVIDDVLPADESLAQGNGELNNPEFWASFTQLDPARLEEIRSFFALCQKHNLQVDIVLMPFDSRALVELRKIPNFNARLEDFKLFLTQNEFLYGIRVHDFTDPASFNGIPNGFSDYYHPMQTNTDLITRIIFTSSPNE